MTLFTQEDLLLYLYKETSAAQNEAIEAALSDNWTLRDQLEELQTSLEWLNKPLESPRAEALLRIFNYAKEADIVAEH